MAQGNLEYAREVVTRDLMVELDPYVAFHMREAISLSEQASSTEVGSDYLKRNLSPRYRQHLEATIELLEKVFEARKSVDGIYKPEDPRWKFQELPNENAFSRFTNRWQALKYIDSILPALQRRLKSAPAFGDDEKAVQAAIAMLRAKQKEFNEQT